VGHEFNSANGFPRVEGGGCCSVGLIAAARAANRVHLQVLQGRSAAFVAT